jgi:LCP family protein required for cell wall assembly
VDRGSRWGGVKRQFIPLPFQSQRKKALGRKPAHSGLPATLPGQARNTRSGLLSGGYGQRTTNPPENVSEPPLWAQTTQPGPVPPSRRPGVRSSKPLALPSRPLSQAINTPGEDNQRTPARFVPPTYAAIPDNSTIANSPPPLWKGATETRATWPNAAEPLGRNSLYQAETPEQARANIRARLRQRAQPPRVYPPRYTLNNARAAHASHVRSPYRPGTTTRQAKKRAPLWARGTIGMLVLFLLLGSGAFAYYQFEIAPALNRILGNQARRAQHHNNEEHAEGQQSNQGHALSGRINFLLLGSDTDGKGNDPENGGAPLAQTVMILTIDPQTKYVGMLSLPRDMQVSEQGYPAPKLDETFMHAFNGRDVAESVGNAAGHMMDVLEENYGIRVDHYAWVGLQGFIRVINSAGGVDVDGIHPMVDDSYPDDLDAHGTIHDYKRVYVAPGPQHLNGRQALEYVRTRHSDLIGDFGRTIRQQQVLSQLKGKLTATEMLAKAAEYLGDLSGSLYTDMNLTDIISVGNFVRDVDPATVERVTLSPPLYAMEGKKRYGNYVPRCAAVITVIQKMFGETTQPVCLEQR